MTVLATVQRFFKRTNIAAPPTSVVGSTDRQVLQILAILEEEGNDLSGRGNWQRLTFEATHTTLAAESQGTIESIAVSAAPTLNAKFRYFKLGTFWDRTENLPIRVIDDQGWQAEKGFAATSPHYRARIRGGNLIVTPTPVAGNTWAFEYVSWHWIINAAGTITYQYVNADTDEFLLPEPIILQGLIWRYKKEKGLSYEEDFQTYEKMVVDAVGRQGIPKTVQMDGMTRDKTPGVVVPQGSWVL